ncbi:MAG: family 16 glycosylhydrolase [Firmicutes bacterium]|nr:family 16 glycosylhydrolase [Bacillota bacterium]
MKRINLLMILMISLVACDGSSSEPNISSSSSSSSSSSEATSVPNGLQPLVPYADCLEPSLEGGWVAQWADEFNGAALDSTKWNVEVNGDGGGNNEIQYYRNENIGVSDGLLTITAKKESYLGKEYTSGRINTKYRYNFLYGRIKVRAKMPGGRGTWAAIWMMPVFNAYGTWPKSGEIDISEYVGYNPDTTYATIHTELFNGTLGTQRGSSLAVETAETAFHDYEMIWEPGNLKFYFDGQKYFEYGYSAQINQTVPYNQVFPFDQDFFIILNVAVGGNWGGVQGVDPDIFPTAMQVDYVRVYRLDYAVLDTVQPQTPNTLVASTLKNTIHWNKSADDCGVQKYAIYVDGAYRGYSNLNQYTFKSLTVSQTYSVQVKAIDFVGRESELSEPLLFTFA